MSLVTLKPVIKLSDMDQEMLDFATNTAINALDQYSTEQVTATQGIASYMRSNFEGKYLPTWHCIVGRYFGGYVTHEAKHYAYFYLGQMGILIFKSP